MSDVSFSDYFAVIYYLLSFYGTALSDGGHLSVTHTQLLPLGWRAWHVDCSCTALYCNLQNSGHFLYIKTSICIPCSRYLLVTDLCKIFDSSSYLQASLMDLSHLLLSAFHKAVSRIHAVESHFPYIVAAKFDPVLSRLSESR